MISIYADEHIDRSVVLSLREKGIDIRAVDEEAQGISDQKLLERAAEEDRAVLTKDSDFVELASKNSHLGVLFLPKRRSSEETVRRIVRIIDVLSQEDLENELIFV